MRNLNPMLYEGLWDWYRKLSVECKVGPYEESQDTLPYTKGEILASLIHQFPKSYVEAYEIHSDLFRVSEVFSVYQELTEINILSLATGSGGDVFGLIQSLETFYSGKKINIYSVEGNKDAMRCQVNLFKQYIEGNLIHNEVRLIPIELVIEGNLSNLRRKFGDLIFPEYGFHQFDMIQSSNWMSEYSVRRQFRFYYFYQLINQWLAPNRIGTLSESVDPFNEYKFGYNLPQIALDDFALFCKQNQKGNQLVALTPTPCIARKLNGLSSKQCQGCSYCYDEFETYGKFSNKKRFTLEKSYAFVMKFVTGEVAKTLVDSLQNEEVNYQTTPERNEESSRFCNLNDRIEATIKGNAFRLNPLPHKE